MSNFQSLKKKKPKPEDLNFQEWGGQFDCSTSACSGWANVAKYFPSTKILAWKCQHGHISRIEDVDE